MSCAIAGVAMPPLPLRCGVRRRPVKEKAAPPKSKKKIEGKEAISVGGRGLGFGLGGAEKKSDVAWQCARNCGACCKLDKGPAFPTPEEIFSDDPSHLQIYKSLVGPDGWCIHYEHANRTCSIYQDRPFFCRVEPDVFQKLYGIDERRFNKEACSSCRDTISEIYGSRSEELKNFNRTIRRSSTI